LCQPWVIVKMIVEKQMECRLAGETEVLRVENLPQRYFCPSQNPTWQESGLNPGRRGRKSRRLTAWATARPCVAVTRVWSWNVCVCVLEDKIWQREVCSSRQKICVCWESLHLSHFHIIAKSIYRSLLSQTYSKHCPTAGVQPRGSWNIIPNSQKEQTKA
jgi:hypothetical protein